MDKNTPEGMRCPRCNYIRSRTIMVVPYPYKQGTRSMIRRRRMCLYCSHIFMTREFVEEGYSKGQQTIMESIPEDPHIVNKPPT